MAHEFIIRDKGKLITYTNYEDIPEVFDHLIKFLPEIPPEPHTPEQHEEIGQWNNRLQQVIKRER
jgi:hypothetical protein